MALLVVRGLRCCVRCIRAGKSDRDGDRMVTNKDCNVRAWRQPRSQGLGPAAGKPELIGAVISHSAAQVLARERQRLEHFDSIHTLRSWRDALVEAVALQGGAYGCALGSMIIQLSDYDEQASCALSQHLASWEALLVAGLRRMQAAGTLQPTADPKALATGLIGALQGGYLLAQANRDAAAMGTALDIALAQFPLRVHGLGVQLGF